MMNMTEVTATETGSQLSEPTTELMLRGHCVAISPDIQVNKMKMMKLSANQKAA